MSIKKTKNLSEFSEFKKICKLTKPRSPIIIEFMTSDPDEWLIDVVKYKKNGIVVDNYMILSKEVNERIDRFKEDGYQI